MHHFWQSSWVLGRHTRMLCVETSLQWWVPVTYTHHVVSISWYWNAVIITVVSLVFAFLGFLSPNCEAILTTVLTLYVFLSMVAGYISACLYKRTVLQWKNNVLMIAFLYLGIFYLTLIWPCGYSTQLQLFCSQHCWPGYFHFDTSTWILDFSVIPIRIFRNQIPWILLII